MSPVTVDTATVTGASRLGGVGYMLNVNAGSKVAPQGVSPFATYPGISEMIDACMFGGQLHVVHAELDSTMPVPWGGGYQYRGPYVQTWNGAAWSMLGGALDPATDTPPASVGDRWGAIEPRLATDGSDLFVGYFDHVVTNIGLGDSDQWLRIAHWNGASWDEVASFQVHGPMGMTVKNGVAYCVICVEQPLTSALIFVGRSDGSSGYVPYSGNPYLPLAVTGSVPAASAAGGRGVGFYTQGIGGLADQLVMFDLDTLAVIRETQDTLGDSPMTPCYPRTTGFAEAAGEVAAYRDGTQFLLRLSGGGYAIVPEDGSGDFSILDGGAGIVPSSPGGPAVDPADPSGRMFWLATFPNFTGGIVHNISVWEQSCGNVPGCSVNAPPYHASNTGWGVPPIDGSTLNSSDADFLGPSRLIVDGDNLYVAFMYYPLFATHPTNTQPFWTQFAVAVLPISRGTTDCPQLASFGSRHKSIA